MKGLLTSWRTDLHPAQKAEFWGEGIEDTGSKVRAFCSFPWSNILIYSNSDTRERERISMFMHKCIGGAGYLHFPNLPSKPLSRITLSPDILQADKR